MSVGIDPVTAGFNPHLVKDDSVFIRTLASLALPSAFVNGELNTDLLESATVLPVDPEVTAPPAEGSTAGDQGTPGPVMSIRYRIKPEAQWNDGTPITVADFEYLASEIPATPGARDAAVYREIASIESANGGKEVTVHLNHRIENWQRLFANLLPSHHMRGSDFTTVLDNSFPASGWRYTVGNVDRQRGVVVLNRNDRFWGAQPAQIEVVNFREITSTTQAIEQLTTGQLAFADLTPTQTSVESFQLLQGAQLRRETSPLNLTVAANATLPRTVREELLRLIDVDKLAHLATGRTANLTVGEDAPGGISLRSEFGGGPDPAVIEQLRTQLRHPVRIGVDSTDTVAADAALHLQNMFRNAGLDVRLVEADSRQLFGTAIPTGAVDLYVGWLGDDLLSRYQCGIATEEQSPPTPSETAGATARTINDNRPLPPHLGQPATLGDNPSGYCSEDAEAFIFEALAGEHDARAIREWASQLEEREFLTLTIAGDDRLQVAGRTIVGPALNLKDWPASMTSFSTWRNKENTND